MFEYPKLVTDFGLEAEMDNYSIKPLRVAEFQHLAGIWTLLSFEYPMKVIDFDLEVAEMENLPLKLFRVDEFQHLGRT